MLAVAKRLLGALRITDVRHKRADRKLTAYEMLFRIVCQHRQGPRNNILLFCTRRSGSTWMLNTLAAHPGMRYVGRPFLMALHSRWKDEIPSLAEAAQYTGDYEFECFVQFEAEAEKRFRKFAGDIVRARRHIYPALHFWKPYFHRVTDRVVFQMTNETALIEWFDRHFPVDSVVQLRHPIPTALSIMVRKWRHECHDFLNHRGFVETHLTGAQVDLARKVVKDGSDLARHVLDWTLKMLIPLRAIESGKHPDWLVITYEETVLDPRRAIDRLAQHLDLPDVRSMRTQIHEPSRTVSAATVDRVRDAQYLLTSWRKHVDRASEEELMRIPAAFGIDVYTAGRFVPADRYLHQAPPADLLETGDTPGE